MAPATTAGDDADPYDSPSADLLALEKSITSQNSALLRGMKLKLRPPKLSEIGPEKFFFGSQTFCFLLAIVWFELGLIPDYKETTKSLGIIWVAGVCIRNWALMLIVYGLYHYLFYESDFAKKCHKFNPKLPDASQHKHDRFWTSVSFLWASCFEVVALYGWANGWFAGVDTGAWSDKPLLWLGVSIAWALFNDAHFYIIHRLIHIGPIYRRVHKLHHRSKNPGPWSGMSMHPVESILYLSRIAFPLFFAHHPIVFYFSLLNTVMMPVPGHSGYEELLGNEYHWLHHHLFTCNYGSPAVPLDWLFGTQVHLAEPSNKSS